MNSDSTIGREHAVRKAASEQLKGTKMAEKKCFVISPIGEEASDTRKRSDQVLKHVITPAVTQCGYDPVRADQISEPGMITSQVIQHIVDDPLVVADLTGRNPNVFYELAIRHAIRKPLVQLIKKGEQIPFDVAGTRTIHIDHHDLDSVEEGRKEIIRQIGSLEKNASDIESPISVSLDLQLLRQSENPEQRSLADLVSVISELRTTVLNVEKRIENPEALLPLPYMHELIESISPRRPPMSRRMMHEMRNITAQLRETLKSASPKQSEEASDLLEHFQMMLDRMMHGEW